MNISDRYYLNFFHLVQLKYDLENLDNFYLGMAVLLGVLGGFSQAKVEY